MKRLAVLLLAVLLMSACTADPADNTGADAVAPTGPSCLPPVASSSGVPSSSAAGKPLPAMVLRCFDGGRYVDVAELGSVATVVNLWGSWCGPCLQELPEFQRFADNTHGAVRVVGVATRDDHDAAQSVIEAKKLTFPMFEDKDLQFAVAVGQAVSRSVANALPVTLFIAPGGRIVYTYQGEALTEARLRALTLQYLRAG